MPPYYKMARIGSDSWSDRFSVRLIASYLFDWIVLIFITVVAFILSRITPNKRPFSLVDPDISFPFTEHETVPDWLLFTLSTGVPVVVILIVSIVFVPGATVPKNTPASLIWKRKLWELHVGLLGLLMSVGCGYFFISGIKNMCGKPRPDLLARCQPDLQNAAKYMVGGFSGESTLGNSIGQLYSADICQQTDKSKLDDGFRSYPSGHSASSAGGLLYLSLFLASKFAVTIPFVASGKSLTNHAIHAAFPSRSRPSVMDQYDHDDASSPMTAKGTGRNARHNSKIQALRRQAAAPPIYLLVMTVAPFCLAIFIAASRWFNFRHHGFDILFGFCIGVFTAIFSFRYYHLPITEGAGWAWGPRSADRAFWAGVGKLGYVDERNVEHVAHHSLGESGDVEVHQSHLAAPEALSHRPLRNGPFQGDDVELGNMDPRMNQGMDHGMDSRI